MPAIEISQEHYDRLMAFKPVVEQITQEEMTESEFADFVVFSAVERLFVESAMSSDLQVIEAISRGDSALRGAMETLRAAQLTLQGLSRRFPKEVFGFMSDVWKWMKADERQDKGMGFHVLWDRYKQEKEHSMA
jgi:hypothetical protein